MKSFLPQLAVSLFTSYKATFKRLRAKTFHPRRQDRLELRLQLWPTETTQSAMWIYAINCFVNKRRSERWWWVVDGGAKARKQMLHHPEVQCGSCMNLNDVILSGPWNSGPGTTKCLSRRLQHFLVLARVYLKRFVSCSPRFSAGLAVLPLDLCCN